MEEKSKEPGSPGQPGKAAPKQAGIGGGGKPGPAGSPSEKPRMSASDLKKAIGGELFDKLATEVFSVERSKEEYIRILSGKGKLPPEAVEALIRYSVDSSEIAERMMGQGKLFLILGVLLFFGSLAVNWITVKLGFVVRILVVGPMAAIGIGGMGIKNILIAQFPFLRKAWMDPLCTAIFILGLIVGLVGFIYYLFV